MNDMHPNFRPSASEFNRLTAENAQLREERDAALQERDQARRMYCTCMESPTRTSGTPAKETAALWEWDCFRANDKKEEAS